MESEGMLIEDGVTHYRDARGNSWRKSEFSREEAESHARSLKSCVGCVDCARCSSCVGCVRCSNCTWCWNCEDCHECESCEGGSGLDHRALSPAGSFYYKSPIVRHAFGYYWDGRDNVWSDSEFGLPEACRLSELCPDQGRVDWRSGDGAERFEPFEGVPLAGTLTPVRILMEYDGCIVAGAFRGSDGGLWFGTAAENGRILTMHFQRCSRESLEEVESGRRTLRSMFSASEPLVRYVWDGEGRFDVLELKDADELDLPAEGVSL